MSVKQKNGILILLVICIYAYAFQLIFEDESPSIFVESIQSTTNNTSKYTFENHNVDPFRSKKRIIYRPKKKKVVEKPKPVIQKPIIHLPQFQITGTTKRGNKRQLTIKYQGQTHFVSENKVIFGMQFQKILKSEIHVLYKDSLFKREYKL